VKVQIGHVHAGRNGATLVGLGWEFVDVGDFQVIAGRESQRWGVWLAVEVEGIFSIATGSGVQG
jgi:hypothetical protein